MVRYCPRRVRRQIASVPNHPPLISVVDDEESVRLALQRLLRALSYDVSIYKSGEEFLVSLANSRPDCVLLDYQMPGLTGADVLYALSKAKDSLPVIIVTAHEDPQVREQVLAAGAVAYFTKPLHREELIAAVDKALHRAA